MDQSSFTCPCCGRTSYNPNDADVGYCGACHDWTGRPILSAAHLALPCPHRKSLAELAGQDDAAKLKQAEVTLATLRDWAEQHAKTAAAVPPPPGGHAAGFDLAVRDVLAILNSRELPEGAPVHMPS